MVLKIGYQSGKLIASLHFVRNLLEFSECHLQGGGNTGGDTCDTGKGCSGDPAKYNIKIN